MKRPAQAPDPSAQQILGADDRSLQPLQIGDRLPAVCGVRDVAHVLGISCSQVHRLHRQGKLAIFELPKLPGVATRYSGAKLQAWIDGTLELPRYFTRARKAG